MTKALRRALVRRANGETGFTLIEVIVAMVITMLVMTTLTYVVVAALKTIQQGKQRQTATALATQRIEQLRAMPYNDVTLGTAASVDPGLLYVNQSGGAPYAFKPAASLVPGLPAAGEPLVVNSVSGHWENQQVDKITYQVHTYVTGPFATGSSQTFAITVVVHWTSSVWPNGRTSVERTTTFQPGGCLSSATSPYNAPCQVYVTARAGDALAGVSITDPDDSQLPLLGQSTNSMLLSLPGSSASFFVEQTANGVAKSTGASAEKRDGQVVEAESGGESAKAAVDSDPSSVPNQDVDASLPPPSGGILGVGPASPDASSQGRLTLTHPAGGSGGAHAAISTAAQPCVGLDGDLDTGTPKRPCASSNVSQNAGATTLSYLSPLQGAKVTLATFAPSYTSRAFAGQFGKANGTLTCAGSKPSGITTVDCVAAGATRTVGASGFGAATQNASFTPVATQAGGAALPAGAVLDLGGKGLWQTSTITETARVAEGTGAEARTFARSGTLWVWTGDAAGNGYTEVNLSQWGIAASASDPQSLTLDILATDVKYSNEITLRYSGKVTVQRPKVSAAGTFPRVVGSMCKTNACVSSVDGSATVVATVQVEVYVQGTPTPWTRFAVVSDLGGVSADVSYKAASDAP